MLLLKYLDIIILLTPKCFTILVIVGKLFANFYEESKILIDTPWLFKDSFNLVSSLTNLGLSLLLIIDLRLS